MADSEFGIDDSELCIGNSAFDIADPELPMARSESCLGNSELRTNAPEFRRSGSEFRPADPAADGRSSRPSLRSGG